MIIMSIPQHIYSDIPIAPCLSKKQVKQQNKKIKKKQFQERTLKKLRLFNGI